MSFFLYLALINIQVVKEGDSEVHLVPPGVPKAAMEKVG
jgi:hypothetical protein